MAKAEVKKSTEAKKSDTLRLRTFNVHTDKGVVSVKAKNSEEAEKKAKEKK